MRRRGSISPSGKKTHTFEMASCRGPGVPATMVALENVKELDQQLKKAGVTFSPEASRHLADIISAITDLDADRQAAHEHLQVATIENSELSQRIDEIKQQTSQETLADVAAAQASSKEEIEQLRKDLNSTCRRQEANLKRQEALLRQNEALLLQQAQLKTTNEEITAELNDQITLKNNFQMHLDETLEQIEELKSCIAAVEQDKMTLQKNTAARRDAFAVEKGKLARDVDETQEAIKEQKKAIKEIVRGSDKLNVKKQETHARLDELTCRVAQLEISERRLASSRCQCEKQLEEELQKQQELREDRKTLQREIRELERTFSVDIQRRREELTAVEARLEESRAWRSCRQDSLSHVREILARQRDEENKGREEHSQVLQRLRQSELQLEEQVAAVARHHEEMKETDALVSELVEVDAASRCIFKKSREELCANIDTEKKNVARSEEETRRLLRLLEEAKREHQEHLTSMTSEISNTRRRLEHLRLEEAELLRRRPVLADTALLRSHLARLERENRQTESAQQQEIQQYAAETGSITRSNQEQQVEVEKVEEVLREVEAKCNAQRARHRRLESVASNLSRRRDDLELLLEELTERSSSALRPRDELKAELERQRTAHVHLLHQQAAELRAVETSVCDSTAKLEQVAVENRRLRLGVRQMEEDVTRARVSRDEHRDQIRRLNGDVLALRDSLHQGWTEDVLMAEDNRSSGGLLLVSMAAVLDPLRRRRRQLGDLSSLLHRELTDFHTRLGVESTVG